MSTITEAPRQFNFLSKYVICVSGYNTDERALLKGMIECCGGVYMEDMECRSVTFLLSKNLTSDKTKHAMRWGVPVLTHQWLFDCISDGRLRSINGYLLNCVRP